MEVSRWGGRVGVGCLLAFAVWGCREQPPSSFDSNLPPETIISGAPAESTQAYYRVHLKWYGSDPDGSIDHFEYAVTDTNKIPGEDTPGFTGYFPTLRTDSVFVFTANLSQVLGHRFYVRAVDNQGKVDPTPAWAYFVALDTNFPNVTFTGGIGTWLDRQGNLRTTPIRSSDRFAPTDTIGVGGSVSISWTGFDVDIGDSVTGFVYRLSTWPDFVGGTLADTTASVSFARPEGASLGSYFSGREAFLVRAIDVADARTNPDSVRSFVVNFSPIAWVVDPDQVDPPVRRLVFTDQLTQQVWPSGTYLSDGFKKIAFKYTGMDDPRDQSLDPNNPSGITGFSYRLVKDGGGLAFTDIAGRPYPQVNDKVFEPPSITSGNYLIQIRARDELGRDGPADTLRLNVNYVPYFEFIHYVDGLGIEQDLWIPSLPGHTQDTVTVSLAPAGGGGYPDLVVRTFARDDHSPPPDTHPLDPNPVVEVEQSKVAEYQVRLNGAHDGFIPALLDSQGVPIPFETSYPVDVEGGPDLVSPGLNRLELRCRDLGGRITNMEFVFWVSLE